MAEHDDDALLDALGLESEAPQTQNHTPQEERIIAGFEDILRFHQTHGRAPQHGAERDIFERLYAVRLDQLHKLPEAHLLLAVMDAPGLLAMDAGSATDADTLDGDALLAELGLDDASEDEITTLRHVRSSTEKKAAEEIADRTSCADFETFQPLFEQVQQDLADGTRKTLRFGKDARVVQGTFFIIAGHLAFVAEVGDPIKAPNGENDARLRVIYDNGTESNILRRSLQRGLYKDPDGRSITGASEGALFDSSIEPDDIETGTIYVLRSQSSEPYVAQHRDLIHKIGVTGGKVRTRIAHAKNDATYLLADVDVVAEYTLHNIKRCKLEHLIHRLFSDAQIDLILRDRFGKPVKPREWFLVPLPVIDEAIQRIIDGSITAYRYDRDLVKLVK